MAVPVLSKDFYLCVCVWHIHSLVWNILIRVDVALFSCHSRGRTFDFYFPFLQTAYMCYDLQINQIRVTSPRTESRRKPRTLWRHYFGHGGASVKRVSAPLAAPGRLAACCIANTVQYKQRRRGGKKRLSNTSQHSFGPSSPRSKPTYQILLEACRTTLRIEKQHGRRRAPNRGRKWRDCGRKSMKPCKEFDYTRRRKVCNMSPCKLFFFTAPQSYFARLDELHNFKGRTRVWIVFLSFLFLIHFIDWRWLARLQFGTLQLSNTLRRGSAMCRRSEWSHHGQVQVKAGFGLTFCHI